MAKFEVVRKAVLASAIGLAAGAYIGKNQDAPSLPEAQAVAPIKESKIESIARVHQTPPKAEVSHSKQDVTQIILERKNYIENKPTMGTLYHDTNANGIIDASDEHICDTLELPWKNNQRNISCIPFGTYSLTPRGPTERISQPHYRLGDVPNRSYILIHSGNTASNTLGCILVGEDTGNNSVAHSRRALRNLRKRFETKSNLQLKITKK